MSCLKNGKTPGADGIPAELLRGATIAEALHRITCNAWLTHTVPEDWRDGIVIPIPKKGDRCNLDNWRGICLLAAAGKVLANIIKHRLRPIEDAVLPEGQCGFREGRSRTDAVHIIGYVASLTAQHPATTLHAVYVDLSKAYDSIPRSALWQVLQS